MRARRRFTDSAVIALRLKCLCDLQHMVQTLVLDDGTHSQTCGISSGTRYGLAGTLNIKPRTTYQGELPVPVEPWGRRRCRTYEKLKRHLQKKSAKASNAMLRHKGAMSIGCSAVPRL